jgi:hypothetical protein
MKTTLAGILLIGIFIGFILSVGVYFLYITYASDRMSERELMQGAKGGIYAPGYQIPLRTGSENEIKLDDGVNPLKSLKISPKTNTTMLAFNDGKYLGEISTDKFLDMRKSRFVIFTPDKLFIFEWKDIDGHFYKREKF